MQDPNFEVEETAARLAREQDVSYAEALHQKVDMVDKAKVKTKEVQKWADVAMFQSEPLDARTGPSVHLLNAPADPLGAIAAMALMYKGVVVRDLADVTDEQRREMFAQIQATKLKAPFEAVTFHWMVEGVTRSLTHQMVRQRTAVFAQESLRFAVVEDGFGERVSLPPSLAGTTDDEKYTGGEDYHRLAQNQKWRIKWDWAMEQVEATYAQLVEDGMPAEDARGLLPHNITTRLNYVTNLRNFQEHGGSRLCTQAQFEWRALWIAFVQELRRYGRTVTYRVKRGVTASHSVNTKLHNGYQVAEESSAWQYELIADLFRPACYLTGKCEFAAMDLDRKCSIRERVDANASVNRPSSEWATEFIADRRPNPVTEPQAVELNWPWVTTKMVEGRQVPDKPYIPAIHPREWLADPGAAR